MFVFCLILERGLERPVADLHDVHALGSGVNLLLASESAARAHDMAEAVEDGDGLALGIGDYNVVVRAEHGNREQAGLFEQGLRRGRTSMMVVQ